MHSRRKAAAAGITGGSLAVVALWLSNSVDDLSIPPPEASPAAVAGSAGDEIRAPELRPTAASEPGVDCGSQPASIDPDDLQQRQEQWASELQAAAAALSASADPEHLLVSAMLGHERGSPQSVLAYQRALAEDPDHPLILWMFLGACSRHPASKPCARGEIERRAIAVEGRNGALWARIAGYRSQAGDFDGALSALQEATTAPEFNDHWFDLLRIVERGFAASTSQSFTARMFAAFGVAATMVDGRLSSVCRDRAIAAAEWQHACLGYGKRLEQDSRTLIYNAIGLGLQSAMYEIAGDSRAQALVEEKRVALRDYLYPDVTHSALVENDERVLGDYLTMFETHGERAAMEYLKEEVALRRNASPGYTGCNPS